MISRRTYTYCALFLFVALPASCSTNKEWLVSGKVLTEVGNQFVTTGEMYNSLFTVGKISAGEYKTWANFATRFKLVYPSVVDAWKTAETTKEAEGAVGAILALKTELLQFFITAQQKQGDA